MIATAIGLLSLVSLIGMLLFSAVLRNRHPRKILVYTHGPLAAAGMVLLNIYRNNHGVTPIESIILFFIASSTGLVLVVKDRLHRHIPKWLAIVHGLLALSGMVCLFVFAYRYF